MPGAILKIGLIYYYAPNHDAAARRRGALLAALLWRGALEGFSCILRAFARYGVHGSIGAVIAFLVWVFLSAVILLRRGSDGGTARLRREPQCFLTVVFSITIYHLPFDLALSPNGKW